MNIINLEKNVNNQTTFGSALVMFTCVEEAQVADALC